MKNVRTPKGGFFLTHTVDLHFVYLLTYLLETCEECLLAVSW